MTDGRAFWKNGRLAYVHAGKWEGRVAFVYPDSVAPWWTLVIAPPPSVDVPGDFYFEGEDMIDEIAEAWDLEWIPRGRKEEELERKLFAWRPLRDGGWVPPPPTRTDPEPSDE